MIDHSRQSHIYNKNKVSPSMTVYLVLFLDTKDPSDLNKVSPCNLSIFQHVSCIAEWCRMEIDSALISYWRAYFEDSTKSTVLYQRSLCKYFKIVFLPIKYILDHRKTYGICAGYSGPNNLLPSQKQSNGVTIEHGMIFSKICSI